ncbi:MAG: zinc-dependent metalloprotease [Vicinamibacterales bacterium]
MHKRFVFLIAGILLAALPAAAQQAAAGRASGPAPTIEDRTSGMRKMDGYFPMYWEERTGSLFLEIPRLDTDVLYILGLSAGLGSNDIGLDRGEGGGTRIVRFQRVGPKVLMVQPNMTFRSSSPNPLEVKSVEDSFAKSVLWGFTVAAETGDRLLVDATEFILRDNFGAANALKPGNYRVDRTRSALFLPNTKNFPKNTEIDVTLTFVNEATGGRGGGGAGPTQGPPQIGAGGTATGGRGGGIFSGSVSSVTPTADAATVRQHLSFVELPDNGYTPRLADPRSGFGGMQYQDYSVPLAESMAKRFIRRHRLIKKDPTAAVSDPVEPIRYWVDSGAPKDIQQALIEGASWWRQAFEAAGFSNAFFVDVLPADADPMDVRYNTINWVHRSTRGWSSGGSVTDPRTGEILKGTVTLGSLRGRQDYLIFEGLLSPYETGTERPSVLYETALARIRQLSAHEVGHTLGLGHNYYDSSKGWISVMDYPHPLESLRPDGTIDLSNAYQARIGDWDKVTINYGYRQFPSGTDEAAALKKILDDAWAQDIRYMTNQDTDIHPKVEQWSNGVDQADELMRLLKVRRAALDRMGTKTIRLGEPTATVEEALVPIFMYHRYAVESAASMVAGQDYIYAMRGDGRTPFTWVTAAEQKKALEALAASIKPSELTVPKAVLDQITPRPPGFGMHRELFARTTGDGFDPLSPGTTAADVTIGFVLQTDRAARMVAQHALDPSLPGLGEVIDSLTAATFDAPAASPYEEEVRRAAERVLVDRVMWLAGGAPNGQVRAVASLKLQKLGDRLRGESGKGELDEAQHTLLAADIKRFLERPAEAAQMKVAPDAPPGAPIGDTGMDWLAAPGGRSECSWDDLTPSAWLFYQPPPF